MLALLPSHQSISDPGDLAFGDCVCNRIVDFEKADSDVVPSVKARIEIEVKSEIGKGSPPKAFDSFAVVSQTGDLLAKQAKICPRLA